MTMPPTLEYTTALAACHCALYAKIGLIHSKDATP